MSVAVTASEPRGSLFTKVAAAASIGLALALSAWGTYGEAGDQGNRDFLVVAVVIAVASAVVFGWVVPRALRKPTAGGTALVLAALAVIAIAVFWSGVLPILAAGAIVLGWSGWNAPRRAGLARAAVILAGLAVVADIAVYIGDMAS